MSKKIKNFLKGIIIIVVFTVVFLTVDKILMLKSEDGIEQMRSFYKQKENTVDVLFLGSSKVYCQIDTGVIWDKYGISAFDLGGAEAPSWANYYQLKEALKTQKPKVIIYDASIAGYRQEVLEEPEVWAITNNYGMHLNKNRIDQLRVNTKEEDFLDLLIPLGTTHSNYDKLTKDDFVDQNNSINYKGYDSRETIEPFDTPDMSGVTECEPVNEKHIIYIDKMKALADEYNIPFVLIVSPYYLTELEQKYFNYVFKHCEEQGIEYIDFNKKYDELSLDFSQDMAENIHLNLSGSKKYSEYLGNYVKENFGAEDHQGDAKYSSWEKDALWLRQDRMRFDIQNAESYEQIFDEINNENYIVFITFGKDGNEITDEDRNLFSKLINKSEEIEKGNELIINNGQTLFVSNRDEFKAFIDEENVKLLFKREDSEDKAVLFVDTQKQSFSNYDKATVVIYDKVLNKVIQKIVME